MNDIQQRKFVSAARVITVTAAIVISISAVCGAIWIATDNIDRRESRVSEQKALFAKYTEKCNAAGGTVHKLSREYVCVDTKVFIPINPRE